jgi:hypothetical protein
MPVFPTYASRLAAAQKAGTPDVYIYDQLPQFLRDQISEIFRECLAASHQSWDTISSIMAREIPSFYYSNRDDYPYKYCLNYLRSSDDINGVLSLIEICGRVMEANLEKLALLNFVWARRRQG